MPILWILALIALLSAAGLLLGRRRALASAGGDSRELHSLPRFYGINVAMTAAVPALLALLIWSAVQPMVVEGRVSGMLDAARYQTSGDLSLLMSDVRRTAEGLDAAVARGVLTPRDAREADAGVVIDALRAAGVIVGSEVDSGIVGAARALRGADRAAGIAMTAAVLLIAAGGFAWAMMRTHAAFRARNAVERGVMAVLIAASSIAVLTTAGIVLSMLFESINFFRQYPASEFFFGTNWAPNFRGDSELGILPLLWGTLYISFIALLVAVPIGLLAAIYMSEYASPRVRSVAKPMLEILAGIPTIVYGLFALVTVGPFLRDYFAQPMGLGNSSSSVMTAGLVMGIMLIPFVSSLSDDVINAVPQTMRDGSLGLGATRSETIRQVVIPAALPGIVGSILLAASRAIGETMIVVLGAGAAARLDLNPFEAMTTVTVKIVSQLTGDTDFASPETLVAFALGLTLFVMTLCLNVFALWIVRRYREQYE